MRDWEKAYRKALIDELRPFGDVLQVGYGSGYCAELIQQFHPVTHVIVEANPSVLEEARKWAKGRSNVKLLEEFWENILPSLGIFDAIFFDECFLGSEKRKIKKGSEILEKGDEVLREIEALLPQITKMRYPDLELDAFCKTASVGSKAHLFRFLHELEENGQITSDQREKMVHKYKLKGEKGEKSRVVQSFKTFAFLEDCIENHMRKGSRFTCYFSQPVSKFEDPLFFEKIVTNPNLEYTERVVVSGEKETLVILVEKLL